jgi:hypothetical protein
MKRLDGVITSPTADVCGISAWFLLRQVLQYPVQILLLVVVLELGGDWSQGSK